MIPYLSPEMVVALFSFSDHRSSVLNSRGKALRISSQVAISSRPFLWAGTQSPSQRVFSISFLAAREAQRVAKERSIRRLRLDLIEMMRLSLQAVDYATKAYSLGLIEFALHVPREREKLERINHSVVAAAQELCSFTECDDAKVGLSESARAISAALFSTCQYAYEVSLHTVALLRDGKHQSLKELVQLGERINASLRLCIVAFVEQKVEYAETVLRSIDEWRYGFIESPWRPEFITPARRAADEHHWSVAANFERIMENLCTIAVASMAILPRST